MGLFVRLCRTHDRQGALSKPKTGSCLRHLTCFLFPSHLKVCFQWSEKRKPLSSRKPVFGFGWKMGFEPTTPGTTIQCSNRLSYIHHVSFQQSGVNIRSSVIHSGCSEEALKGIPDFRIAKLIIFYPFYSIIKKSLLNLYS